MIETPGLHYLLTHPHELSLALPHPVWFVVAIGGAVFLWRTTKMGGWAAAFRVIALLILGLHLSGLALRVALPRDRLSLVVAADRSDSIDATGRRWEEQYIRKLADSLASEDELTVVNFAGETAVAPSSGSPADLTGELVGSTGVTDIARAIDTALALFPADRQRRLVVLTDGNETRGDALSRIAALRAAQIALHAAIPPRAEGNDIVLDKIVAPSVAVEDSVFSIRLVVRNQGEAQAARLALTVDGQPIGRQELTLQPGINSIEVPYRLHAAGNHRLRAEVDAANDVRPANNIAETVILVAGRMRLLLVNSGEHSALGFALQEKGAEVSMVKPAELGSRLAALPGYHGVIFEEVPSAALTPKTLEAIEQYVRNGGAFVLAAGERTYGDPGYRKSALARFLPVTLEPGRPPRKARDPMALYLVIDRSNSMGYDIHNRLQRSEAESKLEYAKRAALAVIEQLRDTDLIGLIVFDSQMFEVAPLRPIEKNRLRLRQDIPRLVPGGGTDFFDALDTARRQLMVARANLSHILLLTDGDTNRAAADHAPLIDALARAGISVTTIRIGEDTVNLQLLNDIAARTGGRFHHVENAELLPQLMLNDTRRAMIHAPRADNSYTPRPLGTTQILQGIPPHLIPEIGSYAFTKVKPGADTVLYVESGNKKDPLLAVWQYGLGRVVAFTGSFGDDAVSWVTWDRFGKLWSQLMHWATREQTAADLLVDAQAIEGRMHLVVQTTGDYGEISMSARLEWQGQAIELSLAPNGPRRYAAPLPLGPGSYPVRLTLRRARGVVEQRSVRLTVPPDGMGPKVEFEAGSANLPLLQALADSTGGTVDAPIAEVVARQTGERHTDHALDWILLPLAMISLLCGVAVRRMAHGR